MLGIESGVPVHLGEIKTENAIPGAFGLDIHVGIAGEKLVVEGPVLVSLRTDDVGLVDHGTNSGAFVEKNGGD